MYRIELTDAEHQALVRALTMQANDCRDAARKINDTPQPTQEHKTRAAIQIEMFNESEKRLRKLADKLENAPEVR